MIDGEAYRKFVEVAQKWRDLAERRQVYFTDLYESGRWQRYYAEEDLVMRIREVVNSIQRWDEVMASLLQKAPGAVPDDRSKAAASFYRTAA